MKTRHTSQSLGPCIAAVWLGTVCLNLAAQPAGPMAGPSTQAQTHASTAHTSARHEQHLQDLKSKLKLSAEQETAWVAFANAMSPPRVAAQADRRAQRAELAALSTPERIDRMKALRQQRQEEMNAQADRRGQASKDFYTQLSPEQRKIFDQETGRHMVQRSEQGPHWRSGRHGHG